MAKATRSALHLTTLQFLIKNK